MNKKVYFAGSIRGGREDADLYKQIIAYIQKNDIVLTEHVGSVKVSSLELGQTEQEIYQQDTNWLKECDVIIAECSTPSLGVGYEMAYGEKLGKETHIFYRPEKASLSAMLAGDDYFQIHPYHTLAEIQQILDSILKE